MLCSLNSHRVIVRRSERIRVCIECLACAGLTRGYGELTKGTGVTVNNLAVGPTYTEGVADYLIGLWKKDNPGKVKYQPNSFYHHSLLSSALAWLDCCGHVWLLLIAIVLAVALRRACMPACLERTFLTRAVRCVLSVLFAPVLSRTARCPSRTCSPSSTLRNVRAHFRI